MPTTGESTFFANKNKFDSINWMAWSKFICAAIWIRGISGYLDRFIKDLLALVPITFLTFISITTSNTTFMQTSTKLVLLLSNEKL